MKNLIFFFSRRRNWCIKPFSNQSQDIFDNLVNDDNKDEDRKKSHFYFYFYFLFIEKKKITKKNNKIHFRLLNIIDKEEEIIFQMFLSK